MPIKPSTASGESASSNAVASGSISARDLIYVKSDGTCSKADATAEGKEAVAFTTTAYTNGQTVTYYLSGNIITGLSGLTPGASYYMSTTPGAMVISGSAPAATGNVLLKIGTALSATKLIFQPETPITV